MSIAYRHRPSHRPQSANVLSYQHHWKFISRTVKKVPTAAGKVLWNVIFIMVFYHVILTLTLRVHAIKLP